MSNYQGVPPSVTNFIRPGKRPVSSMTPTIIVDSSTGQVRMVIGAAGGTRITTSVVYVKKLRRLGRHSTFLTWHFDISFSFQFQTLIRNLWFGENIKEAIDSYRMHHQLIPMNLRYETGFPTVTPKSIVSMWIFFHSNIKLMFVWLHRLLSTTWKRKVTTWRKRSDWVVPFTPFQLNRTVWFTPTPIIEKAATWLESIPSLMNRNSLSFLTEFKITLLIRDTWWNDKSIDESVDGNLDLEIHWYY